jgi:hypothetical protein
MKDYDFFINNLSSLYEQYGYCFLAIKDQKVIGRYDAFKAAFADVSQKEPLGTFIIQECVDDADKLVNRFQFNVTFPAEAS